MDFDRLVQVFLNLARNAIDAMHGAGKLTFKTEGTGLGLPIAQSIVHQHGGLILAESEKGNTVFRVFLPLTHEKENNDWGAL